MGDIGTPTSPATGRFPASRAQQSYARSRTVLGGRGLPAACSGPQGGSEAAVAAAVCTATVGGRRAEVARDREVQSSPLALSKGRGRVGRVQLARAASFPEAHFSASCLQTPVTPRLGNP